MDDKLNRAIREAAGAIDDGYHLRNGLVAPNREAIAAIITAHLQVVKNELERLEQVSRLYNAAINIWNSAYEIVLNEHGSLRNSLAEKEAEIERLGAFVDVGCSECWSRFADDVSGHCEIRNQPCPQTQGKQWRKQVAMNQSETKELRAEIAVADRLITYLEGPFNINDEATVNADSTR